MIEDLADNESSDLLRYFRWKPTSLKLLIEAEERMFSIVKCRLDKYYVKIFGNVKIWTITANKSISDKTPLVMVHGFAGGVGLWSLNYDDLSKRRPVHAFDLLGFGRSSRCKFPKNPKEIEEKYVNSIEEWRKEEKLDKMHLLGHSFGGYLVSCYALKYPDRVKSLILVDPWGFSLCKPEDEKAFKFLSWCRCLVKVLTPFNPLSSQYDTSPWKHPMWIREGIRLTSPFNPFAIVRAAGPWGQELLEYSRKDYKFRFPTLTANHQNAVLDYVYHCNARYPSGEAAFRNFNRNLGYSYWPMLSRICHLEPKIPVTFIFGSKSWISSDSGYETQKILPDNNVNVYSLEGASHNLYADKPEEFSNLVEARCSVFDLEFAS